MNKKKLHRIVDGSNVNQLFNEKEVQLFLEKKEEIVENAEKIMKEKSIQNKQDISHKQKMKIIDIVIKFIKDNRRKIYGGYALNMLLIDKDPHMAIYNETDMENIPDIDFYSPDPIQDIVKLCNIMKENGYTNITGREADHPETYKIFVNGDPYCDITYVPRNIYNKMPFQELKGYNIIGSDFMMIDYFRMLTDILLTTWRIEKVVTRTYKLTLLYPLPHITNPFKIVPNNSKGAETMLKILHKYLEKSATSIVVGFYAYNHFLKESEFRKYKSQYDYVKTPCYEIILENYVSDGIEIIELLKKEAPELEKDLVINEYYPFFQFWGNFTIIYYKDVMVAKLFSNNKKSLPYKKVPSLIFGNKTVENSLNGINIGSFSLVVLYALITVMYSRVNDIKEDKSTYYTFISHLMMFRNYYFKTFKETFLDNTLFQEFVTDCIGIPYGPKHEKQMLKQDKKQKYNFFIYYPDTKVIEPEKLVTHYRNSSGNIIVNPKNLKLLAENQESSDEIVSAQSETTSQ
jgi:hypothetical protein